MATSVLDEGIDVSACNLIIKYNTSSSAVAKIQRAGNLWPPGYKNVNVQDVFALVVENLYLFAFMMVLPRPNIKQFLLVI